jgi:predicted aspartyl protease
MALWIGSLDKSGSPLLKLCIGGILSDSQEIEGIIDTGFTGFLSMPMLTAFPLGLTLSGSTSVTLADGSSQVKLTALGKAIIGGEERIGTIILEWGQTDILIGMAFLRTFNRILYVDARGSISLHEEVEIDKATNIIQSKGNSA